METEIAMIPMECRNQRVLPKLYLGKIQRRFQPISFQRLTVTKLCFPVILVGLCAKLESSRFENILDQIKIVFDYQSIETTKESLRSENTF